MDVGSICGAMRCDANAIFHQKKKEKKRSFVFILGLISVRNEKSKIAEKKKSCFFKYSLCLPSHCFGVDDFFLRRKGEWW